MQLVQLILPLFDNEGRAYPGATMSGIRDELANRFGGITAFSRAPAEGVWSDKGRKIRDDVILAEVMVEILDRDWWRDFRLRLQQRLCQKSIVIRALPMERL